jgi:hypothetical protein
MEICIPSNFEIIRLPFLALVELQRALLVPDMTRRRHVIAVTKSRRPEEVRRASDEINDTICFAK